MAYKIEWTNEALEDMQHVIEFLVKYWSIKLAIEFEALTLARLETLTTLPHIGAASSTINSVRFIIITRHNKLFYQIAGNTIIVLNIFDTRQDPSKNKFE